MVDTELYHNDSSHKKKKKKKVNIGNHKGKV